MTILLETPKLLSGQWDHLVILTYGADLAFFESALWRELPARCKNKIILADGDHYLRAYQDVERNGISRYVNEKYVFDGIFTPHSAHAKLILLTQPERGRLLVGSGNLGMQGYASGGEMFTLYDYSPDAREAFPAFLTIRNFLESLIDADMFRPVTVQHLMHLFEKTPWLFQPNISSWNPVRHNLKASFLAQLSEIIEGEQVEKLWVLSPFYDPAAYALDQLLRNIKPREVHLLVQPGLTSVQPDALQTVVNHHSKNTQIHVFSLPGDTAKTYVHNKLYLLETASRSICLQGSPNLSQVAFLRTFESGNLELANLLVNEPGFFNGLLGHLEIQPATIDLTTLDLSLQHNEEPIVDKDGAQLVLLGIDWNENQLTCFIKGAQTENLAIKIGEQRFTPRKVVYRSHDQVVLEIPPEAISLLATGASITLLHTKAESNPVIPWQRRKLKELLNVQDTDVSWDTVGSLDLKDEILEKLLIDLDNNLLIDRRSVWQVANQSIPKRGETDDEVLRLDYTDIDYEQLRKHPKILQYSHGKTGLGSVSYERNALQILFSSILENFDFLANPKSNYSPIPAKLVEEDDVETVETEEEKENQATEKQQRHMATARRIRRILQNFIKRYIQGLRSPDFQQFAGPDVMVKNYVIFSHILWRLFFRDEIEDEFLIDALLQIWNLFWGNFEKPGVFANMQDETKEQAFAFMREHKSDARLLATVYACAFKTNSPQYYSYRFALRNFLRYFLSTSYFLSTTENLEEAWIYVGGLEKYSPPIPGRIISEIGLLVNFETPEMFLRELEQQLGVAENSCRFVRQVVFRETFNQQMPIDALRFADPSVELTKDLAISIVQQWQRVSPKDYYRIFSADGNRIFQYEVSLGAGSFDIMSPRLPEEIGQISFLTYTPWDNTLQSLKNLAYIVEKRISLGFVQSKVYS